MKKEEKISVIIPTFNRAKLIKKSIESILNQTYKNIELIIVDDGSTDNTEDVVKKIKDNRIKYIKLKTNKGACNARNTGIKKASGDYIAFQDSDDIFHEDKLEKQLKILKKNRSNINFCKICIHDKYNDVVIPNSKQENSIKNKKILDELCNGNFISTQAVLIKTSIAKDILFDSNMPRLQDYDFIMRAISHLKISYTDEILVELYRQDDSISRSNEKLKNAILLLLNKDYKLSKKQKDNLNQWLIKMIIEEEKIEYNELYRKYNELNEKYKILEKSYSEIINSKRWIIMSKILDRKSKK